MKSKSRNLELWATLVPSLPHFTKYINDERLAAIRNNSAAMPVDDLTASFEMIRGLPETRPLWFDLKSRQPRVTWAKPVEGDPMEYFLEIRLNHPIYVPTPTDVLFKAENDLAVLERLEEGGRRLVFKNAAEFGPANKVRPGESIHIRHPGFRIFGKAFAEAEIPKIALARRFGWNKFYLSYVEKPGDTNEFLDLVARADIENGTELVPGTIATMRDLDEIRERVGEETEILLKIETVKGLRFIQNGYRPRKNVHLVAARGDMYVELERPDHIYAALKLIIEKDPGAQLASRILLSMSESPTPQCADFLELAWLADIGYRNFMLCDNICIDERYLEAAINAFDAFRIEYARKSPRIF